MILARPWRGSRRTLQGTIGSSPTPSDDTRSTSGTAPAIDRRLQRPGSPERQLHVPIARAGAARGARSRCV